MTDAIKYIYQNQKKLLKALNAPAKNTLAATGTTEKLRNTA